MSFSPVGGAISVLLNPFLGYSRHEKEKRKRKGAKERIGASGREKTPLP